MITHLYVWLVISFLTRMCSTSHLGDMPALSCPIRNVVSTPKFLCCNKKYKVTSEFEIHELLSFICTAFTVRHNIYTTSKWPKLKKSLKTNDQWFEGRY